MEKHVHHDLICLWANGAIIQHWVKETQTWMDCTDNNPAWNKNTCYRVKPKEPVYEWQWILREKGTNVYTMTASRYSNDEIDRSSYDIHYDIIQRFEPSKQKRD